MTQETNTFLKSENYSKTPKLIMPQTKLMFIIPNKFGL